MYFSTPVHPLLCKTDLILASILLDYYQRLYTHWLLSLSNVYTTKEILLISLKERDRKFQPEKIPENTLI